MPAIVVIGGHWGDEGKGKVVDLLSEQAALVVRYSGGNNAGHTVENPLGHFAMHLIPCGIFHPQTVCIIGNGVAVSPKAFLTELDMLQSAGLAVEGRLFISDRAHLIMPYHQLLDGLEEDFWGGGVIGTTRLGIGPLYADKAARLGIRMADFREPKVFLERLKLVLERKNRLLTQVYNAQPLDLEEVYSQYMEYQERISPFIADTGSLTRDALAQNKLVLLEGAQGTLLDPEQGTYPYVTSSVPTASGAALGSGVPPTKITKVMGVFKAYTTRVGEGPFPTELKDATGDFMREQGHEYGTTTGRPRRCGWFDAVSGRFSVEINDFTGVAVSRLDVLDAFPSLKICTGYKLDGKLVSNFPTTAQELDRCEPVYEELPGWQTSTSGARQFQDLPKEAQGYLRRLETLVGCPIDLVGVGPAREQTICVRPLL
ncbi:MAG TPA: adenylosuccinate synthase [Dehalococcoidia bacterium]|nr:adenylosuccinate synthase [Dehalococcoidia bacterium]